MVTEALKPYGHPDMKLHFVSNIDGQGQESLQIRTTNTNVDDGVDLLAGVTLPLAAADLVAL
jgi:hypothetical protein